MSVSKQQALDYHQGSRPGKIEVVPTKPCRTQRDLSLAYTPGVADPCLEIQKNPHDAFKYTGRGNLVARLISDGAKRPLLLMAHVDVVNVGGVVSPDPRLTLPHPRAHERAFVLVPWLDVDADAELPGRGPVRALLRRLDRVGVRRWQP